MTWLDIRSQLPKAAGRSWPSRNYSAINSAVIHHSGSNNLNHRSIASVVRHLEAAAAWHIRRGWPGIAYHYAVDQLGNIYWLNPASVWLYHAGNYPINMHSVAIMLPGNYEEIRPTNNQIASLSLLLHKLSARLQVRRVYAHRAVRLGGGTICPGRHIADLIPELEDMIQ